MGPKGKGVAQLASELTEEVYLYLCWWRNYYSSDAKNKKLYEGEGKPTPPPYFLLYRRLKLWGGKSGGMPFLTEWGAYLDQPYLATIFLEACAEGERKFETDAPTNGKAEKK